MQRAAVSPAAAEPAWLQPDWPAPAGVRAVFTLRGGGVSVGPCASLNVALHVDDDPAAVAENRRRIAVAFALPNEPTWLSQVHGDRAVRLGAGAAAAADPGAAPGALLRADAAVTTEPG